MSQISFYTKPGCITGVKQMQVLRKAGHTVDERDILEHAWNRAELRSFFGALPVEQWFNPNAPKVKAGEVHPASCSEHSALELMLSDHLLIRRPLLEVNGERRCGFEPLEINSWIGLSNEAMGTQEDLQSCSADTGECPP